MNDHQEILRLVHDDLACYAVAIWPGFELAAHHELIVERLEAVERGEIARLICVPGLHDALKRWPLTVPSPPMSFENSSFCGGRSLLVEGSPSGTTNRSASPFQGLERGRRLL
jgi:hypothetical protein